MSCWWWHSWGPWAHHRDVAYTNHEHYGQVTGRAVIQKRTCRVCGYTQYDEQDA